MRCEAFDVKVEYGRVNAKHSDEHQPKLYSYLLDDSEELTYFKQKPAVIILPGGAYVKKSAREAEQVALRFAAAGIHAFVLDYSVAPSRYPCAMLELAQSIRIIRENAEEWHVNPNAIIPCGFSAGGHAAGCLGTLWNRPFVREAMGGKKVLEDEWKPNGMILCYPIISSGTFTHEESMDHLLGKGCIKELKESVSLEKRVSEITPPTFIWHTVEDTVVPVENSLLFSIGLKKHSIPFEAHFYQKGPHGLSLADKTSAREEAQIIPDDQGWMQLAIRWVRRNYMGD